MRKCIDKKRGHMVRQPFHMKTYPAKSEGTVKCPRCGLWVEPKNINQPA